MININKPHSYTLERQLTCGEERKKEEEKRKKNAIRRKKKVEEEKRKGISMYFFLLFYPRVCSISNYDRRQRHEQVLKFFAYEEKKKRKRKRKGKERSAENFSRCRWREISNLCFRGLYLP